VNTEPIRGIRFYFREIELHGASEMMRLLLRHQDEVQAMKRSREFPLQAAVQAIRLRSVSLFDALTHESKALNAATRNDNP